MAPAHSILEGILAQKKRRIGPKTRKLSRFLTSLGTARSRRDVASLSFGTKFSKEGFVSLKAKHFVRGLVQKMSNRIIRNSSKCKK
jgi:hypothetical protein